MKTVKKERPDYVGIAINWFLLVNIAFVLFLGLVRLAGYKIVPAEGAKPAPTETNASP